MPTKKILVTRATFADSVERFYHHRSPLPVTTEACPHIASTSIPTRRAMADLAVDNLLAGLGIGPHAGRPPNLLNPDALHLRS